MPFWKKGDDPWDDKPPSHPAEPEGNRAPGLMGELRGDLQAWNEDRREKKRQRETPPPPMACPWCGQEMEVGYVTGRDAVRWWPGWPPRIIGGADGAAIRVDHEGTVLLRYKTAYLCRACRRMVLEFSEEALETEPSGWEEAPAETGSADTGGESET